ncbi:MAG: CBS domain-containing protein [Candidatus Baldrarchaeia archaeon]
MSVKVGDVMVRDVVTVTPDESVKNAVRLMNEKEIGCVVVVKNDEPVGILTERDILRKVIIEGKNPDTTKVEEVMSTPIVTGTPTMTLEEAAKKLVLNRIKKLPIVERKKLVGIVTLFDIVRWHPVILSAIRKIVKSEELPPRIRRFLEEEM